jgi:SAM-dependent methyltransferase
MPHRNATAERLAEPQASPSTQAGDTPSPPTWAVLAAGPDPHATADYRYSHSRPGEDDDSELADEPLAVYFMEHEARLVTALARWLFPAGIPRYLDFAGGTGRITRLLEAMAAQSYGIDISAGMLELARRRCPRTTFLEADVTRQGPGLEPMPLVTAFRFFGNAQQDLRQEAMRALSGLVVPGAERHLHARRPWPRACRAGPTDAASGDTTAASLWVEADAARG